MPVRRSSRTHLSQPRIHTMNVHRAPAGVGKRARVGTREHARPRALGWVPRLSRRPTGGDRSMAAGSRSGLPLQARSGRKAVVDGSRSRRAVPGHYCSGPPATGAVPIWAPFVYARLERG
jgi:hypothetical protein